MPVTLAHLNSLSIWRKLLFAHHSPCIHYWCFSIPLWLSMMMLITIARKRRVSLMSINCMSLFTVKIDRVWANACCLHSFFRRGELYIALNISATSFTIKSNGKQKQNVPYKIQRCIVHVRRHSVLFTTTTITESKMKPLKIDFNS